MRQLEAGARIGRFEIVRLLGAGGMGAVYEARDPELARSVALKLIHEPDARKSVRLIREAQALAQLQHPNVVAVHEVGTDGDDVFVAMELVDGRSLDKLSARPTSWRAVVAMFVQAGHGIVAAHGKGLVHRDIKPSNLLVDRGGRVRVGDFGLARLEGVEAGVAVAPPADPTAETVDLVSLDPAAHPPTPDGALLGSPLTGAGALVGTPKYMAPELFDGAPATARSDQYAFCVALGELLPPGAPRWLTRAIERGTSRDPAARHPSMAALVDLLERASARRPTSAIAAAAGVAIATIGAIAVARGRKDDEAVAPPGVLAVAVPEMRVLATRRLTVDAGCEEFPSFAPDGRTLYYDGAIAGTYAIMALDLETGASRRVTYATGWDYAPSVSPDGKWVAFLRNEPDTLAYVAPLPAGEPVRALARGAFRPAWSPDGRSLWVGPRENPSRVDVETGETHASVATPPGSLASVGVEGPNGELLTTLFAESGQGLGVAILAPDRDPRWVERAWYEESMTPLPGRRAALASRMTAGGKPVLVRVGMDGSFDELPLGEIQARTGMSMSPDGRHLAWSNCGADVDLAFVDRAADGSPRLAKIVSGDWIDGDPTAIPETTQLVIASDRRGDPELWVIDATGVVPARRLPSGNVVKTGSAVSRDARWVVYAGGEIRGLFVLPLDGTGAPRQLTADESDQSPGFGADGHVYFQRTAPGGRWDVMRVPFAGGPVELVVEGADTPQVSPDGETLLFVRDGQPYLRDLGDGAEHRLTEEHVPAYWRLAFSGDGAQIGIISNERLMIVDRATGRLTVALEAGTDLFHSVAFVGGRPLLGVQRWEGDLWLADTVLVPPTR